MNKETTALIMILLSAGSASATDVEAGQLLEDFSTLSNADLTTSTGLWNTVQNRAQAARVSDGGGATYRPINFGDGSDGAVDTSSGYEFNTDQKPNGYNFTRINITGGTVTVRGRNPLIIHSLTTVQITPTITVNGSAGTNGGRDGASGAANASTASASGGIALACPTDGGTGGSAAPGTASNGSGGFDYTGIEDAASLGTSGANANAQNGTVNISSPNTDFDAAGEFICGGGGGGGGGVFSGGAAYATGGGGGAGAGTIHITAVGNITVGNISAVGGNGGDGFSDGTNCSGGGAGGHGGAVWLQSLENIPLTVPAPDVSKGLGGSNPCTGGAGDGLDGWIRLDSSTGNRPATSTITDYDTDLAFPSKSSFIQSKPYDLNTLNAVFSSALVEQTANGGSISVLYAGSIDGTQFSEFVNDITELSAKSYRYLKIRMNFTTAIAAAAPPEVSRITVNFTDTGLPKTNLKLSGGCGSTYDSRKSEKKNTSNNLGNSILTLVLLLPAYWALKTRTSHSS